MRKKQKRGTPLSVKVVAVIFAAIGLFSVLRLQLMKNELKRDIELMQQAYAENMELIKQLEEDLNSPIDRDYIIRIARKKHGLCMPNEIVFYNDLSN